MMQAPAARGAVLGWLSLFTSAGTLLCCALPSLLVLAGMGATVASTLSEIPALITLSRHKNWVFAGAGILIAANFAYVYALAPKLLAAQGACDPCDPTACETSGRFSRVVLWCSAGLFLVGCFTAYMLGPLLFLLNP